jgi:hypothetical protein
VLFDALFAVLFDCRAPDSDLVLEVLEHPTKNEIVKPRIRMHVRFMVGSPCSKRYAATTYGT